MYLVKLEIIVFCIGEIFLEGIDSCPLLGYLDIHIALLHSTLFLKEIILENEKPAMLGNLSKNGHV